MSRAISTEAVASLVIGIVVIGGIGLTGATIDSMDHVGASNDTTVPADEPAETPDDGGGGPPGGGGPGDANITVSGDRGSGQPISQCVEPLASTAGAGLVALGFLAIVGLVFYRYNFSAALLVGWTALPPVVLAYFLLTNCGGGTGSNAESGPSIPGSGTALEVSPNVPPWAMLGLVGVLLLGAVGLIYRTMSEEEVVVVEEETDEDADLDEFAEAAGRAADRIEEHDVDVDNAVYRAWVEMTDLLDVENPDTYSPGEFATVAIDLGMDEPDVRELTRLFNEVRYGDKDVETREDRALSVLRNIESQYGTPGSRDDDVGDDRAGDDDVGDDRAGNDRTRDSDTGDDGSDASASGEGR